MLFHEDDLQVDIWNIKHAEVSRVIKKLKNNKSPEDLVMGEMLKATMDGGGLLKLNKFLSTVWERNGNGEQL